MISDYNPIFIIFPEKSYPISDHQITNKPFLVAEITLSLDSLWQSNIAMQKNNSIDR
jgi:hypothetical protein